MRLLARIAVVWVVLGLVVGFLLRARVPWRRLNWLYALSALPWLAHLVYVVSYTLGNSSGLGLPLAVFVVATLLLGTLALGFGWRAWRGAPVRLALGPLVLVGAHALPLFVFSRLLQGAGLGNAGLGMDAIPMVAFICAALFWGSVLLAYAFGRGPAPTSGALAPLRPRR